MRTIGLLGGTSWESTAVYYALLNRGTSERLGPQRQPRILLHSFDFAEIAASQAQGDWGALGQVYADATRALVASGAEVLGICANTMHLVADEVRAAAGDAQLVHIVDATAVAAQRAGASSVALLGTAYTMESPELFPSILTPAGIELLIPNTEDRAEIQRHTFDELILNRVTPQAKARFTTASNDMITGGAQAIVLACTEHAMVLSDGDLSVPVLDSTAIHVAAILAAALHS